MQVMSLKLFQIESESEKFSVCPQLIQVCVSRSKIKITAYQQQYIIVTNQNAIFNEKCIKPYAYSATYFDPYNQVSGYCFDKEFNDSFGYKFSYQS